MPRIAFFPLYYGLLLYLFNINVAQRHYTHFFSAYKIKCYATYILLYESQKVNNIRNAIKQKSGSWTSIKDCFNVLLK